MIETEARQLRIGDTILGNSFDASRENHVRSGVRILAVLPNGVQVRRIHASYLIENVPVESWTIRWDQLAGFNHLPAGTQIPLL